MGYHRGYGRPSLAGLPTLSTWPEWITKEVAWHAPIGGGSLCTEVVRGRDGFHLASEPAQLLSSSWGGRAAESSILASVVPQLSAGIG